MVIARNSLSIIIHSIYPPIPIMKITTNQSGTRTIEITQGHLDTIRHYQLFKNLIDSNGIVNEAVLDKLRLNIRSILESEGTGDNDLLSLCLDVIYHPNMKALGLHNLIMMYLESCDDTGQTPADDMPEPAE